MIDEYFNLLGFTLDSLNEVNYSELFYFVNPRPIMKPGETLFSHIRKKVMYLQLLVDLDPIQCYWLLMKYEPTYNGDARPYHLLARVAELFEKMEMDHIYEAIGHSSAYESYRFNQHLNASHQLRLQEGSPT